MAASNCKRRAPPTAASNCYWPEDVIVEILVRLPLESILKFQRTCKKWYSLIQSPSFIEFHRRHHLPNDHRNELFFSRNHSDTLVYTTNDEPYIISCLSYSPKSALLQRQSTRLFDFGLLRQALTGERVDLPLRKILISSHAGITVLGPLNNGISCVIAREFVEDTLSKLTYSSCKIAFCNLAIRDFNLVSDPFPIVYQLLKYRLRYDYINSYGFASILNSHGVAIDYKMVAIQHNYHDRRIQASVYSQKRGSWDLIFDSANMETFSAALSGLVDGHGNVQFPDITQKYEYLPAQAFLNGYCHWMAQKQRCILRFDMTNEVFGTIAAPPSDDYRYSNFTESEYCVYSGVFVLENHIAAVITVQGQDPSLSIDYIDHIDVWMMMEYGVDTSWTMIYGCKLHLPGYLRSFLGMSFSTTSTTPKDSCCHSSSITIDRLFFSHSEGIIDSSLSLMSCNPSGYVKHRTFKSHWACWKPFGLSPYVETLEPVSLHPKCL